MIPRVIHYCWFGRTTKPDSVEKCIESWKRYCPNFEVIEWNEDNYDINKNRYMREAYERKKWGFVPDYARLDIMFNHGGIYLDTDVEILRPIDELLEHDGFMGFESAEYVALGLGFGACPHNAIIGEMMNQYDDLKFINEDGSFNLMPSPKYSTRVLLEHGLLQNNEQQSIEGIIIYPTEYFCPLNFQNGKTSITDHTFSIHWYDASWFSADRQYELRLKWKFNKIMPEKPAYYLARTIALMKYHGFRSVCKKMCEKLR